MPGPHDGALLGHVVSLIDSHRVKDLGDAQLLQRFAAHGDELAFGALVQRHGRLVLRVCRRVLRHEQDAEDAFQATFLVLARKARSIRKQAAVASWLYGVAYRIATRARRNTARRRERESQAAVAPPATTPSEAAWRELQRMLDEELHGLPDKYRAPFVLCCLEGKSKAEAAQELGWKEGTVSSRLAQARKLLQGRLARRGVSLSAVLSGTALAAESASAVPAALAVAMARAAGPFAAGQALAGGGVSARAVELAAWLLRARALGKAKLVAAVLVVLGVVGGAAGMLLAPAAGDPGADEGRLVRAEGRGRPKKSGRRAEPAAAAPLLKGADRRPGDLAVYAGRVLSPAGRPLGGADVTLVGWPEARLGEPESLARYRPKEFGTVRADAAGRFRLELPRKALAGYGDFRLLTAGGGQPGWKTLRRDAQQPAIELRTATGRTFRGRLVDESGKPAGGVRVQVAAGSRPDGSQVDAVFFHVPPGRLRSWPEPVTTDRDGRFTFRGLPSDAKLYLRVEDPRFAPQWLAVPAGQAGEASPVRFGLAPRRALEGRLTSRATGLPLAGARVVAHGSSPAPAGLLCLAEAETDAAGRYRLYPFPGQAVSVFAYPPAGAAYLSVDKVVAWPPGSPRQELDMALPPGVRLAGKVIERASGKPVAGAEVHYRPMAQNPALRRTVAEPTVAFWKLNTHTAADGTFRLVVLPGPGHLLIKGPSPYFVHRELSDQELSFGRPGGTPLFPDGLIELNFPADGEVRQVTGEVRLGATVVGRLVGADGKPAASAVLLSPTYIPYGFQAGGALLGARDGRFGIPGLGPGQSVPVFFFDARNLQGTAVEIAAPPKGKRPLVRLAACGSATVRLVDPEGKPVEKVNMQLDLVVRPGAPRLESIRRRVPARIVVSATHIFRLQPRPAGQRGTVRFSGLIPGATYLLRVQENNTLAEKTQFTVKAGQQIRLPDLVFPRPADRSVPP
jgi:RNA polymerase sigma factor (sigma-70 family)